MKPTRQHRYKTANSPINIAVCDSSWEVKLAAALDRNHPLVNHWIRNDQLGWTIPWRKDNANRSYEPDFVAICPLQPDENGKPRSLHIIIEVKGREDEEDREKTRWTKDYWLPAVNQDPNYSAAGPWDYLYINFEPEEEDIDSQGQPNRFLRKLQKIIQKHQP